MKNKKLILSLIISISSIGLTYAQSTAAGNLFIAGRFLGWNAANAGGDLPFKVNNNTWMTLQNNTGFFGIGTTAPPFRLTIDNDGGILAMGTFSSGVFLPLGLTTPRMIWYPRKAAFRAGDATGGEWDDVNIGVYSTAFGFSTTASGDRSFSIGESNFASGVNCFSSGFNTFATNDNASVFGYDSRATGKQSLSMGLQTEANGDNSFAGGGPGAIANGYDAFTFGEGNTADGAISFVLGTGSKSTTVAPLSFAFGTYVESQANSAFVMGSGDVGFPTSFTLKNNIAESFMIGFRSQVPTFFVEPPAVGGPTATGKVGIANTNPLVELDVNGQTRVRILNLDNNLTNVVVADANGVLKIRSISTFPGGAGDDDWYEDFTTTPPNNINDNMYHLGKVSIGFPSNGNSKFSVFNNSEDFSTIINTDATALPTTLPVGLYSTITNAPGNNFAIFGFANSNKIFAVNYGVRAEALGNSNFQNIGITSSSTGNSANGNFGVIANSSGSSINFGILALASGGTTNYAGFFQGDVTVTGTFSNPSDSSLKENITTIPNALDILAQLQPRTFNFKTSQYTDMNLPLGTQFGLVAQEVEQILPEIIENDTRPLQVDSVGNIIMQQINYKGINYVALIPILIKGMQEQQAQIDSLTNQNLRMSNNNSSSSAPVQKDVTLSNKKIVLDQNSPNPFKDQTTITYEIKTDFSNAMIIFTDMKGQVIKEVPVTEKGKGQLNVYASDLTNGIYTYTIVVDGITIDTKKMIKQN